MKSENAKPQPICLVSGRVDHGDDTVTADCGKELSTWDKPIQYTFNPMKATCVGCLVREASS